MQPPEFLAKGGVKVSKFKRFQRWWARVVDRTWGRGSREPYLGKSELALAIDAAARLPEESADAYAKRLFAIIYDMRVGPADGPS